MCLIENLMYWDTIGYLPSDILTKIDRASMSAALEVRIPSEKIDQGYLLWNILIFQQWLENEKRTI